MLFRSEGYWKTTFHKSPVPECIKGVPECIKGVPECIEG